MAIDEGQEILVNSTAGKAGDWYEGRKLMDDYNIISDDVYGNPQEELIPGDPNILISKKDVAVEESVEASAFDPANFQPVILIQMSRIYDLLLALLSTTDADKAEVLRAMHESGMTFCPAPAFMENSSE